MKARGLRFILEMKMSEIRKLQTSISEREKNG